MIQIKPLVDVKPGDPIRSESWNNIQADITAICTELNRSYGTLSVAVKNKADGNPITNATVTVIPTGDVARPVRTGLYKGGGLKKYQVLQLLSGAYDVTVEADRFRPQNKPITMDGAGNPLDVVMDMEENSKPMSDLCGLSLAEAMKTVTEDGFQVGRIIDSHGKDIPPGAVPDDAVNNLVLGQVPAYGMLASIGSLVKIHIAARAEYAEKVKVPDLRGLTLEEAKAKLEAIGLVLGETSNIGTPIR
jgi:hypothetical protein